MDREPTACEITITGSETLQNSVSIETLTQVLTGLQKTAYLLAAARYQQPLQQRFNPSKEIKRLSSLRVGLTAPGSYRIPISLQPAPDELFQQGEILGDISALFEGVAGQSQAPLQKLLPDSRYLERVLRELARYLPKPGSGWGLSFQRGQAEPLALDAKHTRQVEHWLAREIPQPAVMTVTGELIRIDFDRNLVTLRYPPTSQELECSYVQDIEDTIVESRREWIQVTGRFTLDAEGHPKSLTDVTRIEPVDLSPMCFDSIELAGRCLRFNPPLLLEPSLEEETKQLLIVQDDDLDIHVYAQTREQLADDLAVELFFLWDEYANAAPDSLTEGAQSLRLRLLARCQEGADHVA